MENDSNSKLFRCEKFKSKGIQLKQLFRLRTREKGKKRFGPPVDGKQTTRNILVTWHWRSRNRRGGWQRVVRRDERASKTRNRLRPCTVSRRRETISRGNATKFHSEWKVNTTKRTCSIGWWWMSWWWRNALIGWDKLKVRTQHKRLEKWACKVSLKSGGEFHSCSCSIE